MEGPVSEAQGYDAAPVEAVESSDIDEHLFDDESFFEDLLNGPDADTGAERQSTLGEREKTTQELADYYGDQIFEYKGYKGTILQIVAMCPAVTYFLDQGFEAVVAWADPYKVVEEKEEDNKEDDEKNEDKEDETSHEKKGDDEHEGEARDNQVAAPTAKTESRNERAAEAATNESRASNKQADSEHKAKSDAEPEAKLDVGADTKPPAEVLAESPIEVLAETSVEVLAKNSVEVSAELSVETEQSVEYPIEPSIESLATEEIHRPVEGAEAVFYSRSRDDEPLEDDVVAPIISAVDTPDLTEILASTIEPDAKEITEDIIEGLEPAGAADTTAVVEVSEIIDLAGDDTLVDLEESVERADPDVIDELDEPHEFDELAETVEIISAEESSETPSLEITPETRMVGVLEHEAIKELVAEEAPLEVLFETIITELEAHMKSEDDEPAIAEYEALVGAVAAVRESVDRLFKAKTKEECREHLEQIVIELSVILRALGYDTPERVAQAYIYTHSPQDIRFLVARLERALRAMVANEKAAYSQPAPQHHRDARVGKVTAYIMQIISRHGASQEVEYAA